jgi:predicted  nucleic acid-binding Zn-ribbon protein
MMPTAGSLNSTRRPHLEIHRVAIQNPESEDSALIGVSYVLKEEEQLAQIWNAQDRAIYERRMRETKERINRLRQILEQLRAQTDTLWERFVTLTLERILSGQLRDFLDEVEAEIQGLSQYLVEADCEIDRLRADLQERRRGLEERIALLEPLAHRTSTQNHLSMMLSRVEGLEAYLLGKKDVTQEAFDLHYKRHTTAPGDLLYLRIRLLTTRVAITAATHSKNLSELALELIASAPDIDQIKTELSTLMTRVECVSDLSRYWLAYLDISSAKAD